MAIDEIKIQLEKMLSPKRYIHSVNVMNTAVKLANKYGENEDEAALAGLIHDCARNIKGKEAIEFCARNGIYVDEISRIQPELLHGSIGALIAKEQFSVTNSRVLDAVIYHTTGCPGMDLLSRIIFVADYVEPARNFPGVEAIRRAAFIDIYRAMLLGIDNTIRHILERDGLLHPNTINTRNWIIKEMKGLNIGGREL